MPSGEKRRSTIRKTATVGTPIVRIQSSPLVQTEPPNSSCAIACSLATEKNDTTNATSQTPHERDLAHGERADAVLRPLFGCGLGDVLVGLCVFVRSLVSHDDPFLPLPRCAPSRYYRRLMRCR